MARDYNSWLYYLLKIIKEPHLSHRSTVILRFEVFYLRTPDARIIWPAVPGRWRTRTARAARAQMATLWYGHYESETMKPNTTKIWLNNIWSILQIHMRVYIYIYSYCIYRYIWYYMVLYIYIYMCGTIFNHQPDFSIYVDTHNMVPDVWR